MVEVADHVIQRPNPILRSMVAPVTDWSRRERKYLARALERGVTTFHGVGLAGPQVGVPFAVFAWDDKHGHHGVVFNPGLAYNGDVVKGREGCLSVDFGAERSWRTVWRVVAVVLTGERWDGSRLRVEAMGYLARIFQHEYDHLEGVLFLDRADRPDGSVAAR